MAREDIFGGLRLALAKGETLKEAMMSFYHAGYKKEDIEEAARELVGLSEQQTDYSYAKELKSPEPEKEVQLPTIPKPPEPPQTIEKTEAVKEDFYVPKPFIQRPVQQTKPQEIYIPQKIDQKPEPVKPEFYTPIQQPHPKYAEHLSKSFSEEQKKSGTFIMIIILIVVLVLLLGVLASLLLYKQEIIVFINRMIGNYF
jgi:hypothetical protein